MNGYELSHNWFDFCFENPEKINPTHTAIYFFAIEHCNRMGWKTKFGFPTQMAMDALGISKHSTYIKYFNDLVEWGFLILVQKSSNQYSSNIISLNFALPKKGKALAKAIVKHGEKHSGSEGESTVIGDGSIIKQDNLELNNLITNNSIDDKFEKQKNESLDFLRKLPENKKNLLQSAGIKTPIVYETERGNICELATMAYHAFYEDDSFIELSMQKHRKGREVIMAQIKAFLLQIQLNEEYKQKNTVKELKTHCTNFLNRTITY